VTVLVSNPYPQEMHCTVNCHVTFSGEGINIVGITCAKSVLGDVKDFELCSRTRDYIDVFQTGRRRKFRVHQAARRTKNR
jgi:hypothetical protein